MIIRNAEETRRRYQEQMGEALGSAFYTVVGHVHYLHAKWGDYIALFDQQNRVELLNKIAPAYFARLQEMFIDDIFLHISRLTDRPRMGKYEHLNMKRLIEMLDDPSVKDRVAPLLADLEHKAGAYREWRNRRIAHTEYELATGQSTDPLPPTTRAMTKEVIDAISEITNVICQHYCDSDLYFRYDEGGGASDLLYVMHDGLLMEKQREARRAAGDYRVEDYAPVDL